MKFTKEINGVVYTHKNSNGDYVRILCEDYNKKYGSDTSSVVAAILKKESNGLWSESIWVGAKSLFKAFSELSVSDNLEVDTKVWISNDNHTYMPAHFSHKSDLGFGVFSGKQTSHTTNIVEFYDYIRLIDKPNNIDTKDESDSMASVSTGFNVVGTAYGGYGAKHLNGVRLSNFFRGDKQ